MPEKKNKPVYFITKDKETDEWVLENENGKEIKRSKNLSELQQY